MSELNTMSVHALNERVEQQEQPTNTNFVLALAWIVLCIGIAYWMN